jgi:hypothetical protein
MNGNLRGAAQRGEKQNGLIRSLYSAGINKGGLYIQSGI